MRETSGEEAVAIEELVSQARKGISKLAKAERKANRRRESKKARKDFTENPFKFIKLVFAETSGSLKIPKEELEEALRVTYSDPFRDIQVESMDGLNRPQEPVVPFDLCRIRLAEIQAVVRKARAKAAGGPNGITYAVYNNCPELTKCLWKFIAGVWESGEIPDS